MKDLSFLFFIIISLLKSVNCEWDSNVLDLPDSHMTRHLNSFKDEAEKCRHSTSCNYHGVLNTGLCWGYEKDCPPHLAYSNANCPGDHKGWVNSKSQQLQTFINQADFGFVKQQIQSMKILCEPRSRVSYLKIRKSKVLFLTFSS